MASLTILEPDKESRTIPLGSEALVVGRSQTKCNLAFDFLGISGKHCEITPSGETFKITDLDSANHTFVNGRKIAEQYLNHGDRIALGVIILIFQNDNQKQPAKTSTKQAVPEAAPLPESASYSEPTFIMDGQKLQKKMQLLRSGKISAIEDEPAVETPAAPPPQPPIGAKARDYAAAAEKGSAPAPSNETLVRWLFFAIGFFAAASVAFALAIYFKMLTI